MIVALIVVFLVLPLLEVYVLVQVGQVIGALPTVALLIGDALLGTWLTKRAGRRAWAAFREALAQHRTPATEVADGALVVLGGALLIAPGFITDGVGVLCLLPPTRSLLRRLLTGVVARHLGVPAARLHGPASPYARDQEPGASPGEVIEGEVIDPE